MRRGTYDEAELERQLANCGFFYGFFGRWMRAITKEWQMYPVGVVFGLGFDTATEVALLATTALLAPPLPAHPVVRHRVPADPVHRRHDGESPSCEPVDIDPAHQVDTGGRRRRRWRSSLPSLTGAKRRSGAAAKQTGGRWRDTSESAHITSIGRRRITRSGSKLATTRRACGARRGRPGRQDDRDHETAAPAAAEAVRRSAAVAAAHPGRPGRR